jgi:pyruvyltransferase
MDAIDQNWEPCDIDQDALAAAFPLDTRPLSFGPDESMWQHPAITSIQFQHDVAAVRRDDAERVKAARIKAKQG